MLVHIYQRNGDFWLQSDSIHKVKLERMNLEHIIKQSQIEEQRVEQTGSRDEQIIRDCK